MVTALAGFGNGRHIEGLLWQHRQLKVILARLPHGSRYGLTGQVTAGFGAVGQQVHRQATGQVKGLGLAYQRAIAIEGA